MFGWFGSLREMRKELEELHNAYRQNQDAWREVNRSLREENKSLRKTVDFLHEEISRLNARLSRAGEATRTCVINPEEESRHARAMACCPVKEMAFKCMNVYPASESAKYKDSGKPPRICVYGGHGGWDK